MPNAFDIKPFMPLLAKVIYPRSYGVSWRGKLRRSQLIKAHRGAKQ